MPVFNGKQSPFLPGYGNELSFSAQQDFGFVGDFISTYEFPASGTTTVMTSGSAVLTMTTAAPFKAGRDEGKRIVVQGAGASGAPLVTTILSITSTTVAVLNANASTTVTANATGPIIVSAAWGTDNTAAITAMMTAVNTTYAAFPGIKISFGQSTTNAYGFPIPVLFNKPVQVEGIGGGYTSDTGDSTRVGGTRLAWHGATSDGGTAFQAFITVAPTGVQSLKRVAFRHLWIDCASNFQSQALIGLKLSSCQGYQIDDFYISNALGQGLFLGIGTTPTEAKDNTRFTISNYCSRQLDNTFLAPLAMTTPILMTSAVVLTQTGQSLTVAANTLPASGYAWTATTAGTPVLFNYTGGGGTTTLTGCTIALEDVINTPTTVNGGNVVQATPSNACSIYLTGGSAANTCCGLMQMMQISYGTTWGPAALEFLNSDSILTAQCMMNGGSAVNGGAINRITRPGVRQAGSIVSATLAARNNIFLDGDPGAGGVVVLGVNNAGTKLLAQSGPHYWELMQLGNGAPLPVIEGNAILNYTLNGALMMGGNNGSNTAGAGGQSIPAATAATITGSVVAIPPQGFQIGARIRWTVIASKTAAGVAARLHNIRIGTTGTAADGSVAQLSLTPTAIAETVKMVFEVVIAGPLGATAAVVPNIQLIRTSPTLVTGWANAVTQFFATTNTTTLITAATFNSGTLQQYISLSFTTGAAEVITILDCCTEILSAGNHL